MVDAQARRWRSSGRGPFGVEILLVSAVIALIVSGGTAHPGADSSTSLDSISPATSTATPLLSSHEVNETVSQVYSWMAANADSDLRGWASQQSVDSAIWKMYTVLNQSSTFDSLVDTWGSDAFHFTLRYLNASGISEVTFGVASTTGNGSDARLFYDYWIGSLTYSNLSEGVTTSLTPGLATPYTYEGAAAFASSDIDSVNWAGYEYWGPGSGLPVWAHTEVETQVATFSTPPQSPENVPSGVTVDPVASVWVGLSPSPGGVGGLLQTGYQIDTKNPLENGDYGLWYEFYPSTAEIPFLAVTQPGDWLDEGVAYSFSILTTRFWDLADYDVTLGFGVAAIWTTSSSYNPHYTQDIVEAPEIDGYVQQIPEFTSSEFGANYFYWYGGVTTFEGKTYSTSTLIADGDFNQYQLTQSSGYFSTSEAYSSGNYDWVTWGDSYYNFDYVNG